MKKRFLDIFRDNTIPHEGIDLKQVAKVRYHKFFEGELKPIENTSFGKINVDFELYGRILEAKREKLLQQQINS